MYLLFSSHPTDFRMNPRSRLFSVRFTAFRAAFCRLLQADLRQIARRLITRQLQTCRRTAHGGTPPGGATAAQRRPAAVTLTLTGGKADKVNITFHGAAQLSYLSSRCAMRRGKVELFGKLFRKHLSENNPKSSSFYQNLFVALHHKNYLNRNGKK